MRMTTPAVLGAAVVLLAAGQLPAQTTGGTQSRQQESSYYRGDYAYGSNYDWGYDTNPYGIGTDVWDDKWDTGFWDMGEYDIDEYGYPPDTYTDEYRKDQSAFRYPYSDSPDYYPYGEHSEFPYGEATDYPYGTISNVYGMPDYQSDEWYDYRYGSEYGHDYDYGTNWYTDDWWGDYDYNDDGWFDW